MKFIITLALLIVSSFMTAQAPAIFNQLEYPYKGKVKSVLIEEFEPRWNNDTVVELVYSGGILPSLNQKILFNPDGAVLMKEEYQKTCNVNALEIDHIWNYYYSDSQLDSVIRFVPDSQKNRNPWKFYYYTINDSLEYEVKDLTFESITRIINSHDQRRVEYLRSDSSLYRTEITFFDQHERKLRTESFNASGDLDNLILYGYNDTINSNPSVVYNTDLLKSQVRREEYLYTEFYDVSDRIVFNTTGSMLFRLRYVYTYDEKGNWIEKKVYNSKDKLINVFRQHFVYYPD